MEVSFALVVNHVRRRSSICQCDHSDDVCKNHHARFGLRAAVTQGGGYQYRLCPVDQTLDERCFRKLPLQFAAQPRLRWSGVDGHQENITGTYLREGTLPQGSTWAK